MLRASSSKFSLDCDDYISSAYRSVLWAFMSSVVIRFSTICLNISGDGTPPRGRSRVSLGVNVSLLGLIFSNETVLAA